MTSEISVIICAYTEKRWDSLVAAVESVYRQTLPAREIIIIIDHNQPLYARVQAQWPLVIASENHEARGLSGARNSGIALASGKFLAFLDDDAVADSNWLCSLEATFSDPQALGVGGPIVPLWLGKKPDWLPEEFYWVVGCTYKGMPTTVSKVRNVIGANMAFRQELFPVIGGFRSEIGRVGTLPMGCEETELCIRAHQHWPQRSCFYQPAALVAHQVPETRARWRYFFSRCYSEGRSKAFVARYVGSKDGLSSERSYVLRTLPLGVLHGLRDGLLRRDPGGFGRAWAIVAGLAATTAGYILGALSLQAVTLKKSTTTNHQGFPTRSSSQKNNPPLLHI